jgi:hypothetical protein
VTRLVTRSNIVWMNLYRYTLPHSEWLPGVRLSNITQSTVLNMHTQGSRHWAHTVVRGWLPRTPLHLTCSSLRTAAHVLACSTTCRCSMNQCKLCTTCAGVLCVYTMWQHLRSHHALDAL